MAARAKGSAAVGEAFRLLVIFWGSIAAVEIQYRRGTLLRALDAPIHLYRLMDFSQLFEAGSIFPRLAPHLGLGYGYATFTYYPPLAVYLEEAFHLFDPSLIASLQSSSVFALFLGGLGTYLLARDLYGPWGGTVAALAYAFVPYRLLTTYVRGDVAESLALGVLPLAIWSVARVVDKPTSGRIAFAGATLAGLILSHAVATLIAAPLIAGVTLVRLHSSGAIVPHKDPLARRDSARMPARASPIVAIALAGLLAGAVSGIYWVPVLVGMRHLNSAALVDGFFDFHRSFIPLGQLVQPDWLYNYQQIYEDGIRYNVGRIQAVLLILSAFWLLVGRPKGRPVLIFGVGLVVVLVWMQQDGAAAIWDALPFLRFVQFPYRLEGPVGVISALLLGSLLSCERRATAASLNAESTRAPGPSLLASVGTLVGVTGLVLFAATSVVNLPREQETLQESEITAPAMWQQEVSRGLIGGNTQGDYLPDTSRGNIYDPMAARANELTGSLAPEISALDASPFRVTAKTSARSATVVTLDQFANPGWLASIDGVAVATGASGPLGLLTVDVPAGEHDLAVWYGGAPGDSIGIPLALAGIAGILLVATDPRRKGFVRRAGFVVMPCVLLAAVVATRFHPPRQLPINTNFGRTARLLSATIAPASRTSPGVVDLDLLWEGLARTDSSCTVHVRLLDADGKVVARRDKAPEFGLRPCAAWQPGEIVHDLEEIKLPPGAAGGSYRISIGLTVGDVDSVPDAAGSAVTWSDPTESGARSRTGIAIGSVVVAAAPIETPMTGQTTIGATVGTSLQIVSADVRPFSNTADALPTDRRFIAKLSPADVLSVDMLWKSVADVDSNFAVFTQLLDATGRLVAQNDGWPDHWNSPTTTWFPGDTILDRRTLAPKEPLTPGLYRLAVGMYDQTTMQRQPAAGPGADRDQVVLGTVKVANSSHVFGQPVPLPRLQTELGQQVRVIGTALDADHLAPGSTARIHVGWQAIVQPTADYTVFVHLMSADGHLVAQHDGPPLGGTLPTSDWDKGDTVYDQIDLALPNNLAAGDYKVILGMYRGDTGARLADANGADTVTVGRLTVR